MVALQQVLLQTETPLDTIILAITTVACVMFSDFFSGLFHWSADNYGDGNTPVFGSIIAAFQVREKSLS